MSPAVTKGPIFSLLGNVEVPPAEIERKPEKRTVVKHGRTVSVGTMAIFLVLHLFGPSVSNAYTDPRTINQSIDRPFNQPPMLQRDMTYLLELFVRWIPLPYSSYHSEGRVRGANVQQRRHRCVFVFLSFLLACWFSGCLRPSVCRHQRETATWLSHPCLWRV